MFLVFQKVISSLIEGHFSYRGRHAAYPSARSCVVLTILCEADIRPIYGWIAGIMDGILGSFRASQRIILASRVITINSQRANMITPNLSEGYALFCLLTTRRHTDVIDSYFSSESLHIKNHNSQTT